MYSLSNTNMTKRKPLLVLITPSEIKDIINMVRFRGLRKVGVTHTLNISLCDAEWPVQTVVENFRLNGS
jgi:hypothetical protein